MKKTPCGCDCLRCLNYECGFGCNYDRHGFPVTVKSVGIAEFKNDNPVLTKAQGAFLKARA